jgi:hypothetical protein
VAELRVRDNANPDCSRVEIKGKFDIQRIVHRDIFYIKNLTRCTDFSHLFLK